MTIIYLKKSIDKHKWAYFQLAQNQAPFVHNQKTNTFLYALYWRYNCVVSQIYSFDSNSIAALTHWSILGAFLWHIGKKHMVGNVGARHSLFQDTVTYAIKVAVIPNE